MPKIARQCVRCGAPFAVWPSATERGRGTFCSRACSSAAANGRPPRTAVTRSCEGCDVTFSVVPFRLKQGRGRFCSRACYERSRSLPMLRACLACDAPFKADIESGHKGRRVFCSVTCASQARRRPQPELRHPPRHGDARQARDRISREIRSGRLPRPNTLPCVDCGHVWAKGSGRHEWDHYLGYDAEHHEAVEVVCSACHKVRTRERKARLHFVQGWLACLEWMKIAASWERWVLRSDDPIDDNADAF